MNAKLDGLLRLLRDDDPSTSGIIKGQLAERGIGALAEMRMLLAEADEVSGRHLREVIGLIESNQAQAIFGRTCQQFSRGGDLEEAAWELGAVFCPQADFLGEREQLDRWGEEVARRFGKAVTAVDQIETLVEFLGEELGFRGNVEDYNNLDNSLLPKVIETRCGIPITLSLVYILVAKRAGMTISGVGMPGHFLIRHEQSFFDPFHGGVQIGLEECRQRMAKQGLRLSASSLQPVSAEQFLVRILNNLCGLSEQIDPPLMAKLEEWIEVLSEGGKTATGE
ncbi:MAG: transglutaminase-like domain-containing protein [Verrucomicrobia bacterium]|nr:transglutaminase-like domain-containing protein [Verrucomicrobiota bacterium]